MKPSWIAASLFIWLVVLVHTGCGEKVCPPGTDGPYDNIDPNVDADFICFKLPPPTPPTPPTPEPPDLGTFKTPDIPGPKQHKAVVAAAIFVESCIPEALDSVLNINGRIDATYSAVMGSQLEREIANRLYCFPSKKNGCEAVRECLGITITPDEPAFEDGCAGDIGMRRIGSPDSLRNLWFNCFSFALMCNETPHVWCGDIIGCGPEITVPTCHGSQPLSCYYSEDRDRWAYNSIPGCKEFDLACEANAEKAFCTGKGASCETKYVTQGNFHIDYRAGIACDDDDTLRTCVNGHEHLIKCSEFAYGFSCIGGSRPHCARDFQCNYDGTNPLPTCDGTSINLCDAGVPTTIDCRSLGFETCDPVRGICTGKLP